MGRGVVGCLLCASQFVVLRGEFRNTLVVIPLLPLQPLLQRFDLLTRLINLLMSAVLFQLLHKCLAFSQLHLGLRKFARMFGDVGLGFGQGDLPQLAFLGQGRLLSKRVFCSSVRAARARVSACARARRHISANACPASGGTPGSLMTSCRRCASEPRHVSSMRITVLGEPVPSACRIFSTVGLSPAAT